MSSENAASMLSQQVLLSVAEHLKLPLLQIARQAELGRLTDQPDLLAMEATADSALRLLDSYALGVRLSLAEEQLEMEPVSVSSVLYDASHQLDAMAKAYGVALELQIGGRFGPVMAHRQGLQSALVSLGMALIEALPALESPQLKLHLAVHRCRYGIVAGLYADQRQLSNEALKQGRMMQGSARQPLAGITHASGASMFVADAILSAMQLRLKASRYQGLFGLATVLPPNPQLQLV